MCCKMSKMMERFWNNKRRIRRYLGNSPNNKLWILNATRKNSLRNTRSRKRERALSTTKEERARPLICKIENSQRVETVKWLANSMLPQPLSWAQERNRSSIKKPFSPIRTMHEDNNQGNTWIIQQHHSIRVSNDQILTKLRMVSFRTRTLIICKDHRPWWIRFIRSWWNKISLLWSKATTDFRHNMKIIGIVLKIRDMSVKSSRISLRFTPK